MMPGEYIVYGADPSYFTRKVEAALRYMRIPHQARPKSPDVSARLEARAGTHLIPVVETPEGWIIHDSTYIIELLHMRFPAHPVIPASPVQHIVCRLLDDWIDEWFTRAALHLRWIDDEDAPVCARKIAMDMGGGTHDRPLTPQEEESVAATAAFVMPWGRKAMTVMAGGPEYQDGLRAEFAEFLRQCAGLVGADGGLLGQRLSMADLGLLGAMKAHFAADDYARNFVQGAAPAMLDWTERAWVRADQGETWLADDALPDGIGGLLDLMAGGFAPYMIANRAALEAGEKSSYFTIASGQEVRMITRKPVEDTRLATKAAIEALPEPGRSKVRGLLGNHGLLAVYEV
ncbi:MAG: glutathioine S-transferase domain protein [Oceanicaulis sp. HLUCCA04]|nr:MAG: glutathioine S-transferase domain protein [Oceanicaulis sp. HLUCCA04]